MSSVYAEVTMLRVKGELGRHLNAFYVQLSTILLFVAVTQNDKLLGASRPDYDPFCVSQSLVSCEIHVANSLTCR